MVTMPQNNDDREFRQLMAQAQTYRHLSGRAKEEAYVRFKRRLSDMPLPVSYEKAIRELCQRLQY